MSLDLPASKAQASPSSRISTALATSDYADCTKAYGGDKLHYKHHDHHQHPCANSPCLLNLHFQACHHVHIASFQVMLMALFPPWKSGKLAVPHCARSWGFLKQNRPSLRGADSPEAAARVYLSVEQKPALRTANLDLESTAGASPSGVLGLSPSEACSALKALKNTKATRLIPDLAKRRRDRESPARICAASSSEVARCAADGALQLGARSASTAAAPQAAGGTAARRTSRLQPRMPCVTVPARSSSSSSCRSCAFGRTQRDWIPWRERAAGKWSTHPAPGYS